VCVYIHVTRLRMFAIKQIYFCILLRSYNIAIACAFIIIIVVVSLHSRAYTSMQLFLLFFSTTHPAVRHMMTFFSFMYNTCTYILKQISISNLLLCSTWKKQKKRESEREKERKLSEKWIDSFRMRLYLKEKKKGLEDRRRIWIPSYWFPIITTFINCFNKTVTSYYCYAFFVTGKCQWSSIFCLYTSR